MAIFGIKLKDGPLVNEFVEETNERLSKNNLVKNPFTGKIKKYNKLYVVNMEPIYYNFGKPGAVFCLALFLGFGYKIFLIPFLFFFVLSFFWTGYFMFYMFRIGLKKKGYKGKCKYYNAKKVIREIL